MNGEGGAVWRRRRRRRKKRLRKQSRKRDAREVDAAFEDVMSGRGEKHGEDKSRVTH